MQGLEAKNVLLGQLACILTGFPLVLVDVQTGPSLVSSLWKLTFR
jgi:hypothetical protein